MKKQLTLGQLIFLISRIDPACEVRYDFGRFRPGTLDSYRGYYDELALGFSEPPRGDKIITAGVLLSHCREAVGKTFTGYKGGEYTMSENTSVWVANWGDCHDTALVGVLDEDGQCILETAYLS